MPLLKADGFAVRSAPGGGVVAKDCGTTLRFDAVPLGQVGLRQVEVSLNGPVPYRHMERVGRSSLVADPGSRAVWTFDDHDQSTAR